MEDGSWNSMNTFRPRFHVIARLHDNCGKSLQKKNSAINFAIVNCTINRRNRRASDDLQDALRDRQTEQASSSTWSLAIFVVYRFSSTDGPSSQHRGRGYRALSSPLLFLRGCVGAMPPGLLAGDMDEGTKVINHTDAVSARASRQMSPAECWDLENTARTGRSFVLPLLYIPSGLSTSNTRNTIQ